MFEKTMSREEWEKIYDKLHAFTDYLLKRQRWFRRTAEGDFLEGKTPYDYVLEAVTRYLEDPGKFDPTKRKLLSYLKRHIIRSLIGNDARCEENRVTEDHVSHCSSEDGAVHHDVDDMAGGLAATFDDEVDYQEIIVQVRAAVADDPDASTIFDSVFVENMTRAEVIAEQQWAEAVFDNGMKRLLRKKDKIAKKYQIVHPK